MRRRRHALALIAGAAVVVAFVACSFPDVGFSGTGADAASDVVAADVGPPDAQGQLDAADTTAPPQQDVDPEGGAHDAATRDTDAAIDRDSGADGGCGELKGTFCDCDQDEALKDAGNLCVAPSAAPDCDDFDPLVHPGEDFVAATWDPTSPHLPANDWNCDGIVTKQYNYGVTCSLLDCTQGFATDLPCGVAGTYNVCKAAVNLLGIAICSVDHTEQRTQGCK